MQEIKLTDSPSQTFNVRLNKTKVGLHYKYNTYTSRWTFDLYINDVAVLYGRKVVLDTNLVAHFPNIDIGILFATDTSKQNSEPNRENIPAGVVRMFSLTEEELLEATS